MKHYRMAEVDQGQLIARLEREYPDGWALSASSPSLRVLLPMCPSDTRVMAWVKTFASFKPNVNPAYAWEPVLVRGGRKRTRDQMTVRDWVAAPITLRKGISGAKPQAFVYWLIDILNMKRTDDLDDLFPGTEIVSQVLADWRKTGVFDFRIAKNHELP